MTMIFLPVGTTGIYQGANGLANSAGFSAVHQVRFSICYWQHCHLLETLGRLVDERDYSGIYMHLRKVLPCVLLNAILFYSCGLSICWASRNLGSF